MDGFQPGIGPSRSQRIGVIALVAVAAFFIWRSLVDLPLGTIDNPGPGAMPLVLAALLAIFALWSLGARQTGLLDESAGGSDTVVDPDHAAEEAGARRHALLIVGSIVAAALAPRLEKFHLPAAFRTSLTCGWRSVMELMCSDLENNSGRISTPTSSDLAVTN